MLLATKLKNAIKREMPETNVEFVLHNINVNGRKLGCSGFVVNKDNGKMMYVTTDTPQWLGYMYRQVKSTSDYIGGCNRWAKTEAELVKCVVASLMAK
jgi:hypothetical protein